MMIWRSLRQINRKNMVGVAKNDIVGIGMWLLLLGEIKIGITRGDQEVVHTKEHVIEEGLVHLKEKNVDIMEAVGMTGDQMTDIRREGRDQGIGVQLVAEMTMMIIKLNLENFPNIVKKTKNTGNIGYISAM